MRLRILILAVITLPLIAEALVAGRTPAHSETITGRIVAYRPLDRIIQMASFVPNRELFLFEVQASNPRTKPYIVKINYSHFGFTDITNEMLDNSTLLKLNVRRDQSCNETYSHSVSTAPEYRDKESGALTFKGIEFVTGSSRIALAPETKLPCYSLEKSDFEVIPYSGAHH
jgi:hypothetical protein